MTFVLIPGAGGDGYYWHLVAPLLGPDTIAVDLPAGDPDAGLDQYADAIVAAAGDANDVTLVAQSMGGFSAPLAVGRLDVRRIVLVNAMVPKPGETAGEWWDAVGQPAARHEHERAEGRDPEAPFDVAEWFFHDVPAEVAAEAMSPGRAAGSRTGPSASRGRSTAGRRCRRRRSSAVTTGSSRRPCSAATSRTGSASSPPSSTAGTWWRWPTLKVWPRCFSTRLTELTQLSDRGR